MSAASDLANSILPPLLVGVDFTLDLPDFSSADFDLPAIDLSSPIYAPVPRLTNDQLTEGTNSLSGSGIFDVLMRAFAAHLRGEFESGRISGSEYTKAYIACVEAAMGNGAQFLLNRESTYWAAVNAQLQAQTARVGLVTAKVQLESEKTRLQVLRYEALGAQVAYGLNKMRLASESVAYDAAKYNLDFMLPKQLDVLTKQAAQIQTEVDLGPQKLALLTKQVATQEAQTLSVKEQTESSRAQTLDTRTDGTPVSGSVGRQKDLYAQQITSYKRDAEVKAAKVFTDAWTVMKTIDEGLAPPTGYSNANLDTLLATLRTNNNI